MVRLGAAALVVCTHNRRIRTGRGLMEEEQKVQEVLLCCVVAVLDA